MKERCSQHELWIIPLVAVLVIIGLVILENTGMLNQGLAMVIVTTILAAITMYYALLNKRLLELNQSVLKLNQRVLEVTTDPQVVVYIRPWQQYVQQDVLVIENIGNGIAFDIHFEVLDQKLFQLKSDLYFTDLPCVAKGIKSMSPKQHYKTLIESTDLSEEQRRSDYKIKVNYVNSQGRPLSDTFTLNINENLHYLYENPLAEHLKKLAENTDKIASQSSNARNQPSHSAIDGKR